MKANIAITRTSILTGIERTKHFDITQAMLDAFNAGGIAQGCFPKLTPAEREFIMTGITEEEFPRDEEEEGDDGEEHECLECGEKGFTNLELDDKGTCEACNNKRKG